MPNRALLFTGATQTYCGPMRWFLFLACLTGCAEAPLFDNNHLPAPSGAEEATAAAWKALGNAGSPPAVYWVDGLLYVGDETYLGYYQAGEVWLRLDLHRCQGQECRPSQTSLVHELVHATLDARYGSVDSSHTRPEWADVHGVVVALRDRGL